MLCVRIMHMLLVYVIVSYRRFYSNVFFAHTHTANIRILPLRWRTTRAPTATRLLSRPHPFCEGECLAFIFFSPLMLHPFNCSLFFFLRTSTMTHISLMIRQGITSEETGARFEAFAMRVHDSAATQMQQEDELLADAPDDFLGMHIRNHKYSRAGIHTHAC